MFLNLKPGDEVAILPSESSPAVDVLVIALVTTANSVFVKLADNRIYSTLGGKELDVKEPTYVMPATDVHREKLAHRQP